MDGNSLEEAVLALSTQVFQAHYVVDPEVRRKAVKMMIERGMLFDASVTRISPELLNMERNKLAEYVPKRKPITIPAGLRQQHKATLAAWFPMKDLFFEDNPIAPHGLAWAQKKIHTQLIKDEKAKKYDRVIDIGGNPKIHTSSVDCAVHACTLREGEAEYHRHVQHEVAAECFEEVQLCDTCTGGTEKCFYKAKFAMCVHTGPNIDPDLWPIIFENHGLEVCVYVHHYHPDQATTMTEGYIADVGMHWRDVDGIVEHHFDDDSSHPYPHRRDWLNAYARPWVKYTADGSKAVVYSVLHIGNGVVRAEARAVDRSSMGKPTGLEFYLWTGGEETVWLSVPIFKESLGFSDRDTRGYELTPIPVERRLYNHVFNKCVSGDTGRPDTPLTFTETMEAVMAFNRVRTLVDVPMTSRVQLGANDVSMISRAMYLAILRGVSQGRVQYGRYTVEMRRLQKRWGQAGVFRLIYDCAAATVAWPYLWLCDTFTQAVDVVAVVEYFSQVPMALGQPLTTVPYVKLPAVSWEGCDGVVDFVVNPRDAPADELLDIDISDERRLEVLKMVKATATPEVKARIDADLVTLTSKCPDPTIEVTEEFIEEENKVQTRDDWYEEFKNYRETAPDISEPVVSADPTIKMSQGTPEQVGAFVNLRVKEYELYNGDMKIECDARVVQLAVQHFTPTGPNYQKLARHVLATDDGSKYFREVNGKVQCEGEFPYMAVCDPATSKISMVRRKGDQSVVEPTRTGWLFVHSELEIYNHASLARAAGRALETEFPVRPKVTLHDGIAGVGKTFGILEKFTMDDVYITGPRLNAAKFIDDALKLPRFAGREKDLIARVKSVDGAALKEDKIPRAKTLYVDEGLMLHTGSWWAVAMFTRAKFVEVYGCHKQLPFYSRASGHMSLLFARQLYWDVYIRDVVGVRNPLRIVWIIANKVFPTERDVIKTRNPHLGFIESTIVPNPADERHTRIRKRTPKLCHSQGDKTSMVGETGHVDGKPNRQGKLRDGCRVLTTHEAQGDSFACVHSFRLNKYKSTLYESVSHAYVAISRAVIAFQYTTVVGDMLHEWIQEANLVGDEELSTYLAEVPDWVHDRNEKALKVCREAGFNL